MRILHLCDGMPPFALGGAGAIMCGLAAEQSARGHDVHILTAATDGELPASPSWTVHGIPRLGKRFAHFRSVLSLKRAREVADAVAAIAPDVVHAHAVAFQLGYRWMPMVARSGVPIVMTFHDAMQVRYGKVTGDERHPAWREFLAHKWTYNPLRHTLIKRCLRSASALVSVSDALASYLERYGLGTITTVRNGIDLAFWSPRESRAEARARLGLPNEGAMFLIAGRLGGSKGLPVATAALPAGSLLLTAGDAPAEGMPAAVRRFPRQTSEGMRALYEACDAVLVPSAYLDPFPTVCLEAMAMGRPVLATATGGAREAVADGAGWIIDPNDRSAWAEKMAWCAGHRGELDDVGAAGRAVAERSFGVGRMADDMERAYAEAGRGG